MKKIISIILTMAILFSVFSVSSFAFDEEEGYTLDEVITMYEDSVFITATGGEIEVFNAWDNYDTDGEYSYDEQTIKLKGNPDIYNRYSLVKYIEDYNLTVERYNFDINDDENYIFEFDCINEIENISWYIEAQTDINGYILYFEVSVNENNYIDVVGSTSYDVLTYLDNIVYINATDGSRELYFGEFDFIYLIKTPGTEYYVEAVGYGTVDYEVDEYDFLYIQGRLPGNVELQIKDADTDEILETVYVKVNFSIFHWILYYVCFGWLWM